MSTVEIETGTYIKRFAFWNPATWSIPKLYWDAWSIEQRTHAICRQLEKVIAYADYLGVNTDDIAARLKAIEEGQLDEVIEAAIESWFEENEPEILQAIASLNETLPVGDFSAENTVKSNLDRIDGSIEDINGRIDSSIETINTQLSYNIITVEQYGAIGDGVTDSTQAIQDAIAENPNCIIAFKGGKYIVSDTVHCWGNNGGQLIDLGGSNIQWNGGDDKPVFSIDATYYLTEDDYLYPYLETTSPYESECRLCNGTVYAGDYGIKNNAFHTIIDNLKIIDADKCAIVLGNEDTHISMQAKITDIHIMRSRDYSTYWSEEASAKDMSLLEAPCAILLNDPDCNFNDININRYPVAVRMKSGGHTFENCHFTAEYKDQRGELALTAAVVIDLFAPTSIYTELFDTCYFDNHKYCFWANTAPRHVINVTDGFYFNSGHQVLDATAYYDAFFSKNIVYLSVRDFNVVPGTRCRFFPGKLTISGSNYQGLSLCNEEYIPNIYSLTDNAHVFYTANQKAPSGRAINVIRTSNEILAGNNQCVGCLILNGTSIPRFNTCRMTVSDRNYLWASGIIRYNGNNLVYDDVAIHGSSLGRYQLWIGSGETVDIDGNSCLMFPIYIHAVSNVTNTPIFIQFDDVDMNVTPFLNAGGIKPTPSSSESYEIQFDFTS